MSSKRGSSLQEMRLRGREGCTVLGQLDEILDGRGHDEEDN